MLTSCCFSSGLSSFTCLAGDVEGSGGKEESEEGVEVSREEEVNILFLVPPLNIAWSKGEKRKKGTRLTLTSSQA